MGRCSSLDCPDAIGVGFSFWAPFASLKGVEWGLYYRGLNSLRVICGDFTKLPYLFLGGVPTIRITICCGLYWGPLIQLNYHISQMQMSLGLRV